MEILHSKSFFLFFFTLYHFTSPAVKFTSPPPFHHSPRFPPPATLLCSPYALIAAALKGEMIQVTGTHGRAAAGHCTCSSEKQPDACMFENLLLHVYVCVQHMCMHSCMCTVRLFFLIPNSHSFLHPSSLFPSNSTFILFSFVIPWLSNQAQKDSMGMCRYHTCVVMTKLPGALE